MIPVCAIRFTRDCIDGGAIFRHDNDGNTMDLDDRPSIYKTLDSLVRGMLSSDDLPPLEMVLVDGSCGA